MKALTAAVVGFGDRAEIYSRFALKNPDLLKITAVVDPDPVRRGYAQKLFCIPEGRVFSDYDAFVGAGRLADFVINGTMDELHISTTLPLLPLGYDVLLEKPVTSKREELLTLLEQAKKYGNKIIVCHVLRYTPFYRRIKEIILSGEIGRVRHISTSENVGVAHASISYIRGKWNNRERCGSSYMLAKCCHDADLLCWLNDGATPKEVCSMGGREYFIPENAPKGAGTRCLTDCPLVDSCPYSAKYMHVVNNPMPITVWSDIRKLPQEVTERERIEALKTTNPHGACIFKTDADIVDQQVMTVMFSNGSVGVHTLFSSAMRAGRSVKIYGTLGEIEGFTEDNAFKVRTYNKYNILFNERMEKITENIAGDNHYGGDSRLMEDCVRVFSGRKPSISTSGLEQSVYSHLIVYAADESMEKGCFEKIQNLGEAQRGGK